MYKFNRASFLSTHPGPNGQGLEGANGLWAAHLGRWLRTWKNPLGHSVYGSILCPALSCWARPSLQVDIPTVPHWCLVPVAGASQLPCWDRCSPGTPKGGYLTPGPWGAANPQHALTSTLQSSFLPNELCVEWSWKLECLDISLRK